MKPLFFILCLTALLCSALFSTAQKEQKVCLSPLVTFERFQKGTLNLSVGAAVVRSNAGKGSLFSYGGLLGVAYFPKSYLEVGLRLKPMRIDYKTVQTEDVLEKNIYVRYHPFLAICRKTAFFVGVTAHHDGASYSVKEQPTSRSQLFGGGSVGLTIVPKPMVQVEINNEIFFGRAMRHSLTLVLNFKAWKIASTKNELKSNG